MKPNLIQNQSVMGMCRSETDLKFVKQVDRHNLQSGDGRVNREYAGLFLACFQGYVSLEAPVHMFTNVSRDLIYHKYKG